MIKTGKPVKKLSVLCKLIKKVNPTRILSSILVLFMLFSTASCSLHNYANNYSASGFIIDQQGKGVEGVTVYFSDDSKTVKSGADGSWEVGDLSGTVVATPYLESTIFRPAKKEITGEEDNIYFKMDSKKFSGLTSQDGEFIFNTPSGFEQDYKVTVIVEDKDSSESLNNIEVEAIYSGKSLDIIIHDNDGNYLPGVLIVDLENLDNYPTISIGNPAITVVVGLIAVGLKAYSIGKFVGGAILIAKGAGGITVKGALISLGIAIVSEGFSEYFKHLIDNQKTEHPVTIYIFDNKEDVEATTTIKVAAGASIDDIMDAVLSVTGDIEVEILIPERNSAGAYYNPDGSPKVYYVYMLENQNDDEEPDIDTETTHLEVADFIKSATSFRFINYILPVFDHPNELSNDDLILALTLNGLTPYESNDYGSIIRGDDVQKAARRVFGPDIKNIEHRSVFPHVWHSDEHLYSLLGFGPGSYTEAHVLSIDETETNYIVDVAHAIYYFGQCYDEEDCIPVFYVHDEFGNFIADLAEYDFSDYEDEIEVISEYLPQFPIRRYILNKEQDGTFYIMKSNLLIE